MKIKDLKNNKAFAEFFGLVFGDGWLSKNLRPYKDKWYYVYQCGVSADPEDLYEVKNQISKLFSNIGKATIRTTASYSAKYNISGVTNMVVFSKEVATTLEECEMPIGKRTEQNFYIPSWIVNGNNDIKRYFLSGLYAAEGTSLLFQKNNKTLKAPDLVLTKRLSLAPDFTKMCDQIAKLFSDLGIEINIKYSKINAVKYENMHAKFVVANNDDNIQKLIESLPLNFCKRKQEKASLVMEYLLYKKNKNAEVAEIYNSIMKDKDSMKIYEIAKKYKIPRSTVEGYIYGRRKKPMAKNFLTFDEYSSIKNSLIQGKSW